MNLRRLIWNASWLTDKQRIEWYPAFWLIRPKVLELSSCWRQIKILLPHSWVATNVGGSLFGGFQACLADPIVAMSCIKVFGYVTVKCGKIQTNFLTP